MAKGEFPNKKTQKEEGVREKKRAHRSVSPGIKNVGIDDPLLEVNLT